MIFLRVGLFLRSSTTEDAGFDRSESARVRGSKPWGMKRKGASLMGSLSVFVFFCATAVADTIFLKNGRKLEGIVTRETDKLVEIEVGFGTLKLTRDEIQSIERTDDGGHLFLATRINGKVDATLLLDTGASVILLSREKAEAAKLDLDSPKRVKVKIADGRTIEAIPVMLETVRIGEAHADNVQAAVLAESLPNANFDGLLGMSFLNRFIFQVDYANKKLILEKRR